MLKLADFGMSRNIGNGAVDTYYSVALTKEDDGSKTLQIAPPAWSAPEEFQAQVSARSGHRQYMATKANDVWAFAVTLFELTSGGQQPYLGEGSIHHVYPGQQRAVTELANANLIKGFLVDDGGRLAVPDGSPEVLALLQTRCWASGGEPATRMTMPQVVATLWRSELMQAAEWDFDQFKAFCAKECGVIEAQQVIKETEGEVRAPQPVKHRIRKIAFSAKEKLGIKYDDRCVVTSVTDGGQAQKKGVRSGWIVHKVGGKPVTTQTNTKLAFKAARNKKSRSSFDVEFDAPEQDPEIPRTMSQKRRRSLAVVDAFGNFMEYMEDSFDGEDGIAWWSTVAMDESDLDDVNDFVAELGAGGRECIRQLHALGVLAKVVDNLTPDLKPKG